MCTFVAHYCRTQILDLVMKKKKDEASDPSERDVAASSFEKTPEPRRKPGFQEDPHNK